MADFLKLLEVNKNKIVTGEIAKSLSKGKYSVLFEGYPVIAESLAGESFESGENVLLTEVSGAYKILGKLSGNAVSRKTIFIRG